MLPYPKGTYSSFLVLVGSSDSHFGAIGAMGAGSGSPTHPSGGGGQMPLGGRPEHTTSLTFAKCCTAFERLLNYTLIVFIRKLEVLFKSLPKTIECFWKVKDIAQGNMVGEEGSSLLPTPRWHAGQERDWAPGTTRLGNPTEDKGAGSNQVVRCISPNGTKNCAVYFQ